MTTLFRMWGSLWPYEGGRGRGRFQDIRVFP